MEWQYNSAFFWNVCEHLRKFHPPNAPEHAGKICFHKWTIEMFHLLIVAAEVLPGNRGTTVPRARCRSEVRSALCLPGGVCSVKIETQIKITFLKIA